MAVPRSKYSSMWTNFSFFSRPFVGDYGFVDIFQAHTIIGIEVVDKCHVHVGGVGSSGHRSLG